MSLKLKRVHERTGAGELVLEDGQPKFVGVEVLAMPVHGKHHWPPKLMNQGETEGWLSFDDKRITITDIHGEEYHFRIDNPPCRVCNYDGAILPSIYEDREGAAARAHVQALGKKKKLPRGTPPYEARNYFETTVEE